MSRSVVLSDGSHVQHSMLATQLNSHVVSNALRANAVIRVTKVRAMSDDKTFGYIETNDVFAHGNGPKFDSLLHEIRGN
jgi:hypothetical protein